MDSFQQSREMQFIQQRFREFYSKGIPLPSSLHMREFGFGFSKKIDFRHKAFNSELELKDFILRELPLFISYSAATYRFPASQPMPKKEYLGAELIFDLDATYSHENHSPLLCNYCLEKVKGETIKLLEDFLLNDFGFSKGDVKINFSGNKGYHLHLENEKFMQLSQEARKQLMNYASGFDVDLNSIIVKSRTPETRTTLLLGPSEKSRGWAGKIYGFARNFISSATLEQLRAYGLGKKDSERILSEKEFLLSVMKTGKWGAIKSTEKLWLPLAEKCVSEKRVEIDRQVTIDLARLIRLPDSLHGDSGLIAKTLSATELQAFSPSKDAVAFSNSKTVKIKALEHLSFVFGEQSYEMNAHEEKEVPESAAIFLLCKKKAKLA